MKTIKLKDGNITIYNRTDSANFYASYSIPKGGRKQESLKTKDIDTAKNRAFERYAEIEWKSKNRLSLDTVSFKDAANEWLRQLDTDVKTGARKERHLIDYKPIAMRYLIPYFGDMAINEIQTLDVERYRSWRNSYWQTGPGKGIKHIECVRNGQKIKRKINKPKSAPSPRTASTESVVLRSIFDYAVMHGWLTAEQKPEIVTPTITTKQSRQCAYPHFEKHEFDKLRFHMADWINEADLKEDELWRRIAIRDCVLLLFYTGLRENELHKKDERTGKMTGLRWKDIQFVENDKGTEYAKISVSDGKTGGRTVIAQREATAVLKNRRERCPSYTSDDFILAYPNGKLTNSFASGIERLLVAARMRKCPKTGNNRGIYSCRHSYATWRLADGVNPATLARNMGTSIAMIDKSYYHHMPDSMIDEITGGK